MKTYADYKIDDTAEISRQITAEMVELYANLVGDTNPVHLDEQYAAKSFFKKRVAHGLLISGLISAVLGTQLPGPGSIYLSQNLEFKKAVYLNDTLTAKVTVTEKVTRHKKLKLRTYIVNQNEELVLDGEAVVLCR